MDDDQNIFQTSLIDRYAARPTTLDNTTWSGQNLDEENHDSLPKPDEENKIKLQRILLSHDLGYMYKWGREAVVQFDKFNLAKESNKVYWSKLVLYLPWKIVDSDILGGYMTFKTQYNDHANDVL